MNKELMGALDELERDKNISKETLLDAIEQSLIQACKNHFGKADNVHVTINRETGDFSVFADRTVVEYVDDPGRRDFPGGCTEAEHQMLRSATLLRFRSILTNSAVSPHRMRRTLSFRRSARKSARFCMTSTTAMRKRL